MSKLFLEVSGQVTGVFRSLRAGIMWAVVLLVLNPWAAAGGAMPVIDGSIGYAGVFELVAQLPVGQGPGRITVLPDVPSAAPRGPQVLAVDKNGTIYIADSAGRQIHIVSGEDVQTLSVPWIQYARDLTIRNDKIYILDVSDRIWVVDKTGFKLDEIRLAQGMTSYNVLRLMQTLDVSDEVLLWCNNYVQLALSQMPAQVNPQLWDKPGRELSGVNLSVKSPYYGQRPDNGRSIRFIDQNHVELLDHTGEPIQVIKPVGGGIGSARLVHMNHAGLMYVLVEELGAPNPGVQVELSLRIHNPRTQIGAVRLPIEDMVAVPWQPVAVQGGALYVLVPGSEWVSVYRVYPGQHYVSQLTHDPVAVEDAVDDEITIAGVVFGKFKGYPISQTRASTRSRAHEMMFYTWTWRSKYDYLPDGTPRSSTVAIACEHLKELNNWDETVAIPYAWGGWDSPWTYSDNRWWSSFADALGKYSTHGPLVGNRYCHGTLLAGTAGIDCAGFVAAASDTYHIGSVGGDECYKPGTGHLSSDGKTVEQVETLPVDFDTQNYAYYSGMQPMSFFVNQSHVLFYDYRRLDGSGLVTLESTIDGWKQAAKSHYRTWSDLRTYVCKSWWDKEQGDDFDVPFTYQTSRSAIQGAQVYYKFLATGTTHIVTVTRINGDPDLYVYDSDRRLEEKSATPGSDSVTVDTIPGNYYYVKVHAWDDCSWTISW